MRTITINTTFETIKEFDDVYFDVMGLFDPKKSRVRVHVRCRGTIIGTRWM